MNEFPALIKESFVGGIKISTVYEGNMRANFLALLEELGAIDSVAFQNLRAVRPESMDLLETFASDGVFLYGPYYETTIFGGRLDGRSTRSKSITAALAVHEEMVETVKANLSGHVPS